MVDQLQVSVTAAKALTDPDKKVELSISASVFKAWYCGWRQSGRTRLIWRNYHFYLQVLFNTSQVVGLGISETSTVGPGCHTTCPWKNNLSCHTTWMSTCDTTWVSCPPETIFSSERIHIPPLEEEQQLEKLKSTFGRGYVSSQEGTYFILLFLSRPFLRVHVTSTFFCQSTKDLKRVFFVVVLCFFATIVNVNQGH